MFIISGMVPTIKSILSKKSDLFNGYINYYLKMYKDLYLNLLYITMYKTTMFHLLTIFFNKWNRKEIMAHLITEGWCIILWVMWRDVLYYESCDVMYYIMWCIILWTMWCDVLYYEPCDVMYYIMSHVTWCIILWVMWRDVLYYESCDVMYYIMSHHDGIRSSDLVWMFTMLWFLLLPRKRF